MCIGKLLALYAFSRECVDLQKRREARSYCRSGEAVTLLSVLVPREAIRDWR